MLFAAHNTKEASMPLLKKLMDWRKSNRTSYGAPVDTFFTAVKITETKDSYTIVISKQGLAPSSLNTTLTADVLTVSADFEPGRKYAEQVNETVFSKSFSLPGNADKKRIRCSYKDGTIKLVLCKRKGRPVSLRSPRGV